MGMQSRALLAAAVALSMASCGGGDDEPAEREGPQITKARLIERGDAICQRDQARVVAQLEQVLRPQQSDSAGAILVPYLERNEQAIRSGAKRIEALGRPSSDADVLDDYLDERTTAANALRTALAAAKKNDTPALEDALRDYSRNRAQEAATRFGFKLCGLGAGRVAQ